MQGTIRQLLHYNNEINGLQGSIMFEFFRPKIREFSQKNKVRLESASAKITKLRNEFLETDEHGNAKFVGEGKDRVAIFKEGKTQEEFDKAYNELLETEITIII